MDNDIGTLAGNRHRLAGRALLISAANGLRELSQLGTVGIIGTARAKHRQNGMLGHRAYSRERLKSQGKEFIFKLNKGIVNGSVAKNRHYDAKCVVPSEPFYAAQVDRGTRPSKAGTEKIHRSFEVKVWVRSPAVGSQRSIVTVSGQADARSSDTVRVPSVGLKIIW